MIINDAGRQILSDHVPLRLTAELVGGALVVGYDHTGDVKKGDKLTCHQAEIVFEYDLQCAEEAVTRFASKATTANEFSALVANAFNRIDEFKASRLLKRHNLGMKRAAALEFIRNVTPETLRRRSAERALYLEVPS